ncbi:hybrid sensor histidine kinase/response regulator [Ketobacter sp.]|uniref:hybrid sensor histidine kinase/response regulator n=1 Tax=Ketobacter sp. TaxID=2083498 RepID=UPI000F227FEC|nr:hybrid sensor histidine kinase/response regulator [Ketobacter sp.]RLT94778.1 MAG: hybrid sensor histidine kinase/response regulator [Ketobacter sp.]
MVASSPNWDSPLFADDDDDTPAEDRQTPHWKVLIVDDEEDVLAVTKLVFASFSFQGHSIQILTARSAAEARSVLQDHHDIAVAFIDVVMEADDSGLELVRHIREELHNDEIQLILRTGQPGYAPEMKVILEYGINDYRTKTELDNVKLLSCLVAGLRNYHNVVTARQAVSREEVTAQLNRAKSLFFAQMSHDLRTPLNSILGFCQLLETSSLDDEQSEQVRMIHDSGHHLLALVNDILDLSKGEAGKIQLEAIPFSLPELVQDTVTFLMPQVQPGVVFDLDMDGSVPHWLEGDPVRVRQILYNLLSNAFKFTARGRVRLGVRGLPGTAGDGRRVQLRVEDTGSGIPTASLDHLFDVYEQADASVNRSHGGTGLGLHICKQLAELMQGSISVTSELGKGSTFCVELCLAPVHDQPAPNLEPVQMQSAPHFAHILVVDDDRVNRMLLQKMLERRGLQVTCAESGDQALARAREHPFDLVLMDCQMPGLSGMEATRRLRTLEGYSKVPILALTGNGRDEMAECFKAGMNDFMSKPLDMDGLNAMVAKWLGFRTMLK